MTEDALPAWSEPFAADARARLARTASLERLDRAWAWEGSTGRGVTVAIIDSGLERDHPALEGRLVESVAVELVDEGSLAEAANLGREGKPKRLLDRRFPKKN